MSTTPAKRQPTRISGAPCRRDVSSRDSHSEKSSVCPKLRRERAELLTGRPRITSAEDGRRYAPQACCRGRSSSASAHAITIQRRTGLIGASVSRTPPFLSSCKPCRRSVLLRRIAPCRKRAREPSRSGDLDRFGAQYSAPLDLSQVPARERHGIVDHDDEVLLATGLGRSAGWSARPRYR